MFNGFAWRELTHKMAEHMDLFHKMDPPWEKFDRAVLGPDFAKELETVSGFWFRCGYRPGIAAYLNFFLLKDFITLHDDAAPPRFQSFKSMANSFYQTDLFIRDVTDSGLKATGGVSSETVRTLLKGIMDRHKRVAIPGWMMTYFGLSLLENVEKQCAPLSEDEKRRHLSYMATTYRLMGIAFSKDRSLMESFGRSVETAHAGLSPNVEKHARNVLVLGEMVGVSSRRDQILSMLPEKTRSIYEDVHDKVRPGFLRRMVARAMGKLLMPQAVGEPRRAVPAFD